MAVTGRCPAEEIAAQIRSAVRASRPVEVWGGGTLLRRMEDATHAHGADRLETLPGVGVVAYEPADLVITVGAGMTVLELDALLAANGQECPLDTVGGDSSTVGGRIATALSGPRRLGCGPVRDWLLGLTFVTGDGVVCRGGGATVKNVTGFDLPRLLCGSWGTLGVLVDVTLKVRPRPRWSGWYWTDDPLDDRLNLIHAPVSVMMGPTSSAVLLEGDAQDGAQQSRLAGLSEGEAPVIPGPSRCAVGPDVLSELLPSLPAHGWLVQWDVGVIHLDPGFDLGVLDPWRSRGDAALLRLDGGPEPDLARPPRQPEHHRRLRDEFDPAGVLAPWRFPT